MSVTQTLQDSALHALETAINQSLRLDPETWRKLDGLGGRLAAIELRGLDLTVYVRVTANGLRLAWRSDEGPQTVLKGTPLALLKMALAGDAQQGLPEELEIAGDVETARRFQDLLAGLDIDWEEQLARLIGDVAAHETGRALRTLHAWCRQTAAELEQDAVEYLREEQAVLPYRDEVEDFLAAVDTLRDDVERLEQRIRRLQRLLPDRGKREGA